ncbi:MAG: MFS transporter [Chloroflexi bacterium]|nr:MFS transporter [Chloroflexota bacterium]MDA1147657.1 MFS transporter [Chloroflexota bacterium]
MDLLRTRFPAFGVADYRRLFIAASFTSGARWALVLGRGWLVFELTDSAFAVGMVTFAGFFPFVVVGPFAGVIADRVDRRRMLLVTSALGVVTSFALVAVTVTDVVQLWHVLVLAFIAGSAQASTMPPQQALLANIVPKEHLLSAVSLSGLAQHGSRIIGPLFGAALLSAFGAGAVFILSAALLTCGLIAVWLIKARQSEAEQALAKAPGRPPVLVQLRDGFDYARSDRRVATVLILVAFHCGFTMAFDSMMPTLSTMIGGDSGTYGSILIGLGAGAVVGILGLAMLSSPAAQGRAFFVASVGSGLSMLALGFATIPAAAVAGAVLAGATQASFMALSVTFIQQIVPDAYRGRVLSLYSLLAAGHMAFINLGFGWLSEIVGVRPLLIVPGLLWVVIFLVASAGLEDVRQLLREGSFGTPIAPPATAAAAGGGGGAGGD